MQLRKNCHAHAEHAGRNNTGLYSLVIGAAVAADAPVPAGMVRVAVPASQRAVFDVDQGRFDLVGAAWQSIWQRSDRAKTFIDEYEQYHANDDITISIGLRMRQETSSPVCPVGFGRAALLQATCRPSPGGALRGARLAPHIASRLLGSNREIIPRHILSAAPLAVAARSL